MVPRHVTLLSAIFVSHLFFLGAVDSAPNAALLKLMAAKQAHFPDDNSNNPPHSSSSSFPYINLPFLSSHGNENDDDDDDDDNNQNENLINDLWLSGNGNHAHPEEEEVVAGEGGEEEDDEGRQLLLPEASKRFHPSAFYGSRGKRLELAKRFFHQGFVGSRGKRLSFRGAVVGRRAGEGEGEGKGEGEGEGKMSGAMLKKRFHPAVYTAVRGKRYMPGLEALFLSQMYKKLDAEKWKRQSLLGFHAARG